MTDGVTQLFTMLGTIIGALIASFIAARKGGADGVKVLEPKLDQNTHVTTAVHSLVNGQKAALVLGEAVLREVVRVLAAKLGVPVEQPVIPEDKVAAAAKAAAVKAELGLLGIEHDPA